MINAAYHDFAPIMNYPAPHKMEVFDLTKGYTPEYIRSFKWGIGKYNEKRRGMYTTSQFEGKRDIHMGIDIWTEAGSPVFSFESGRVAYLTNNKHPGDYGPTIILRHEIEGEVLFALYGHLSTITLTNLAVGDHVNKSQQIGTLGDEDVNGGWVPHLHFQLAVKDPGEANMPGVVSEENLEEALELYPDPRKILGHLY